MTQRDMSTAKELENNGKTFIVPPCISDSGTSICIISRLHEILEEDIRIDLEKTSLTITALAGPEKVMRNITVPEGLRISRKKYRDGILTIVLDRPA
jgi:HSP20 family molecular chaperone IbpA